ncbi:kinase-like domain-containing protein [Irpex rosettiformis]|uniref:Kinase-like domain-containing protein n=1 Tax=Irpex rosettiformis TaxID=378272 RepID=A0ACB8UGK6_9APHY|nr:kinase-like domain-containing protein [Irpex rosettiformis]
MVAITSFNEADLLSYSDEELAGYIEGCSSSIAMRNTGTVLSQHIVAKPIPSFVDPMDEVLALEKAQKAGVRVPSVIRIVPLNDGDTYLIMDRIYGSTLEECWKFLNVFKTFRLAWQLRAYLRRLASVVSQTTGGVHSGEVRSEWLQGQHGPIRHASPSAFSKYLNWWLLECYPTACSPRPELLFTPEPHNILCHQDLAPRNMVVDRDGVLWLVDWRHAGFYPPIMEYAGIEADHSDMSWLWEHTWVAWWGRVRWSLFRWIACSYDHRYSNRRGLRGLYAVYQRSLRFGSQRPCNSEE